MLCLDLDNFTLLRSTDLPLPVGVGRFPAAAAPDLSYSRRLSDLTHRLCVPAFLLRGGACPARVPQLTFLGDPRVGLSVELSQGDFTSSSFVVAAAAVDRCMRDGGNL